MASLQGEQHQADYARVNPFAQVPSLLVGDTAVTQSLAIIEYLEEAYPSPPLMPADVRLRAPARLPNRSDSMGARQTLLRGRVRQFSECINSGIQPLQNLALLQQ